MILQLLLAGQHIIHIFLDFRIRQADVSEVQNFLQYEGKLFNGSDFDQMQQSFQLIRFPEILQIPRKSRPLATP